MLLISLSKYGYNIARLDLTILILYGPRDLTVMHMSVKTQPTTMSISHVTVTHLPEIVMPNKLHIYAIYGWPYVGDMCDIFFITL